jgi:mannose-6-phosphate isomerase-like protein (cupin superfamily)
MSTVEQYRYGEEGFKPHVHFGDWQVAHLNWEPVLSLAGMGEVERHVKSDEVFVLWKGKAVLFVCADGGVDVYDMEPGTIYNVPAASWHNLIATGDASWIIVESAGTDLHDTEYRKMMEDEQSALLAQLPAWALEPGATDGR